MKKLLFIILFISFKMFSQENIEMPVFPNCEKNKSPKKCFQDNIAKQLIKNTDYFLPDTKNTDYQIENSEETENSSEAKIEIVNCFFTINYQGKIKKIKIQGSIKKNVRKQFKNNLKKLPTIKPGTLDGEPTDLPFVLPVLVKEY